MSALRFLQLRFDEPRAARAVILGVIGLWTALVLWYIWRLTADSITRDEWRFVEILRHWYAGRFSLADIWSTNTVGSEHRVPAFKLYFLADALWFGLDVRLGCYIGALALGVFALLLYRYFLRTRPAGAGSFDHYAFLPVAITLFSFCQSHIYTYDLLAMFAITGTMLFGALWMQMDLKLRAPQPAWRYLVFALLLALLLLGFGAGKNPALALATLVLAAGLALQGGKPVAWKVLAWLTAGALLAELVYFGGGPGSAHKRGGLSDLLDNVLGDLGGAIHYVLHALGAAFITGSGLYSLPEADRAGRLDVYGGIVLAAALAALAVYVWSRGYRRALLPLVLATFTAGYLAELVLGRFGGGTDNGSAPRYVYTDHLLVVACVFVFADALTILHRSGKQRAARHLLVALSLGVAWVEIHNQRMEFRSIDSQANAQQVAVDAALARLAGKQVDYPRWYCPDQRLCDEDMRFLAEHHLSLARGAAAADSAKP